MIHFITGNQGKLEEAKTILGNVNSLDIDLPEIQEIDAHKVIAAKLEEALKHHQGEFIVEDTSLYLDALKGLPGPLIKWFLKTIGQEGLAELAQKLGNDIAEAKTIVGYADNKGEIKFFDGSVRGRIVSPRGTNGFGWDQIFQPDGYKKTFGELEKAEKNRISMRKIALQKLADYLK